MAKQKIRSKLSYDAGRRGLNHGCHAKPNLITRDYRMIGQTDYSSQRQAYQQARQQSL